MKLYSTIIIPLLSATSFLNLEYSKLKKNNVSFDKVVKISVDESASPLFYPLKESPYINEIKVEGELIIDKEIGKNPDDTYFQLGVIYEGDYRPSGFIKSFLPEWLLKVLSMSETSGVSEIQFLDVSNDRNLDKTDSIRDITLNFKTVAKFQSSKFKFTYQLKNKKVLGLWLRADGDDSKAKFDLTINKLELLLK